MNVDGLFVTCPKWINSFFVNNVHLKNYIHFSQFRVFSLFGIRRVYRYHLEHSNPEGYAYPIPSSIAYMRQWAGSALVQIMARRLFGAKPLPEPMLTYCQLDPCVETSVFSFFFRNKRENFSFKKIRLNMSSAKWRPFCPGGDELTKPHATTTTVATVKPKL